MSKTFSSERFQKTFDAYFWKWWMVIGILYFVVFSVSTVLLFNREFASKLGWINTPSPWIVGDIAFGAISIGFISIGALSVGIVAIGACSVGIVAVGAFSVGIFAFGGNALGLIAIGAGTRYGWINLKSAPRGRFDIGKVAGIVAVGARGVWVSIPYLTPANLVICSRRTVRIQRQWRCSHVGCRSLRKRFPLHLKWR